ncbi:PREDICTED: uncharacterized protein LOC105562321 [Vollenhovia emeryi]|uniref:uncharacterized protein LOC105562321 n=1 Tax=Vollenhovia emeryi TaxID=411798 RepID=UPI0005F55CA4|nr:PREDICTED: uncharacterized protein LOC105562321 [Vollenhovia emeryi]
MTFKMAYSFCWIVIDLRIMFSAIFIDNYVNSNKIVCIAIYLIWFSHNVCKFLLINYVCEIVTTKAQTTRDLINKLSYSTCDVEVREIISQFSLQMNYVPLRFCGIGFFQFGFKFLHKFVMSIATVLVIVLQANTNK